jgi:hypothetical protein
LPSLITTLFIGKVMMHESSEDEERVDYEEEGNDEAEEAGEGDGEEEVVAEVENLAVEKILETSDVQIDAGLPKEDEGLVLTPDGKGDLEKSGDGAEGVLDLLGDDSVSELDSYSDEDSDPDLEPGTICFTMSGVAAVGSGDGDADTYEKECRAVLSSAPLKDNVRISDAMPFEDDAFDSNFVSLHRAGAVSMKGEVVVIAQNYVATAAGGQRSDVERNSIEIFSLFFSLYYNCTIY